MYNLTNSLALIGGTAPSMSIYLNIITTTTITTTTTTKTTATFTFQIIQYQKVQF